MDYSLDSIYEGLYEYYINDYIIFEGILRRDYYECIGVLNEDGNKNFLKQLWEKILKILKGIRDKIKELIDKIFKRNKEKEKDNSETKSELNIEEMIKKYKKLYDKYSDKLNDFKIDNWNINKYSVFFNTIQTEMKSINIYCISILNMYINHIDIKTVNEILYNKNFDSNKIYDIYKKAYYSDSMIEHPFRNNNITLLDILESIDPKKNIEMHNGIINNLSKIQKEIKNTEKKVEQQIKELENNNIDPNIIQLYLKAANKAANLLITDGNIKIKYLKQQEKDFLRLFRSSYKFLENIDKHN